MSPQKQRIAIATACGWKAHVDGLGYYQGVHPALMGGRAIPDYLNNLNACHEMEAWLKDDDRHAFSCYASDLFEEHGSDAVHLTAAQRCEAFLRTMGLWEEEANTTKSASSTSAATEESSATLSESFRDGITYTRSYQVFLPTPKPTIIKSIFTTPNPTQPNQ